MLTEAVGWAGSILLLISIMQVRPLRFRVSNLGAAALLLAYTVTRAVWPMALLNAALVVVNIFFLVRLLKRRAASELPSAQKHPQDGAV
ncbi:hypothetical protein [Phytoactinopolyspora limicola]|uniref:hypothetical protein n=1 Tax=Phytoactinopolyspora limicola TaxID=2715536 RepID=UPI00140BF76C|nr:hypothetical protein [Phytoactinopolyspora limicola]